MSKYPEHQLATETAQAALRGEALPPVQTFELTGPMFDADSGLCYCARCGLTTLDLYRVMALPHPLNPELAATGLRCRSCGSEQAITLTEKDGAVILTTTLQR